MVATWLLGLWLVWDGGWHQSHTGCRPRSRWLSCCPPCTEVLVARVRDFAADRNRYSAKFYRIINEIPAVLMVGIVLLVVLKPF